MVCFITLKMIDGRFAPVKHAFEPLQREENLYQRAKHFALKYPPLYRIRKATKSVCTFLSAVARLCHSACCSPCFRVLSSEMDYWSVFYWRDYR